MEPISAIKDLRFVLGTLLFIVLLLVGIYLAGKYAGKTKTAKDVKIPSDLDVDAGEYYNPGPLTDALYNDIYSGILSARDVRPYEEAITLSNAKLAVLINDWNRRYFGKSNESLREAIANEWLSFGSFSFRAIRDQLVARLASVEQLQR